MKITLGVGIPTYNRYDLLEPALRKYTADFRETNIYVVDNGQQNIPKGAYELVKNNNNIGVGATWNQLCSLIFSKFEYALILNDDIYLGRVYQEVVELLSKKRPLFIRATPDWCVFALHKEAYEKVGCFDECFYPAYYEDKSYEYRMKLKGIPTLKHPFLNPITYQSSKTLEKDPTIFEAAKKNKKLYVEMWGGEPGKERLKQPNKSQ